MWQDESRRALEAFMDGDEELAAERWGKALALAEREQVPSSLELGLVYYYLGKVFWDRRQAEIAVPLLETAVQMMSAHNPRHEELAKVKYILGNAYSGLKAGAKAVSLYRDALGLEEPGPALPFEDALKILHKCKLALELKGEVFADLCDELNLDPDGDNHGIEDVLLSYYETDSARAQADNYVAALYDGYDLEELVKHLAALIGKAGQVKIVKAEEFEDDSQTIDLELSVGEESYCKELSSVDDVFDVFNDILLDSNSKVLFQKLDTEDGDWSQFYLLDEKTLDKLEGGSVLRFIDLTPYGD